MDKPSRYAPYALAALRIVGPGALSLDGTRAPARGSS
jgi:hypothetical protein